MTAVAAAKKLRGRRTALLLVVAVAALNAAARTSAGSSGRYGGLGATLSLKKLIGMPYAAGTSQPGTTTAQMQAERTLRC